jgi:DNA polymerase-3 subunit alpha (Gram-positive type)
MHTTKTAMTVQCVILLGLILAGPVSTPAASDFTPPAPDTPLSNITFVAFDTETTGFGTDDNRILEIGAVKFRDGKILEEKSWLINPERWIPYPVQKVHGITPEMIKNKPNFKATYPEFADFVGDAVLLAHNAPFDVGFVAREAKRNGITPMANPIFDSLPLFRTWFPDAESHSLEPLSEQLGVNGQVYHRATDDSRYIALIMQKKIESMLKPPSYDEFVKAANGPKYFSAD